MQKIIFQRINNGPNKGPSPWINDGRQGGGIEGVFGNPHEYFILAFFPLATSEIQFFGIKKKKISASRRKGESEAEGQEKEFKKNPIVR